MSQNLSIYHPTASRKIRPFCHPSGFLSVLVFTPIYFLIPLSTLTTIIITITTPQREHSPRFRCLHRASPPETNRTKAFQLNSSTELFPSPSPPPRHAAVLTYLASFHTHRPRPMMTTYEQPTDSSRRTGLSAGMIKSARLPLSPARPETVL